MRNGLAIELRRTRINQALLLLQSGHSRKHKRGQRIIKIEQRRDAGPRTDGSAGMARQAMRIALQLGVW